MSIRIYGKIRRTIRGNRPNPFYCDWRPDEKWRLVNITTASPEWGRALSPMFVGPVEIPGVTPSATAVNIESAWQYSKVYGWVQNQQGQWERHVGADLNPTPEWWAFARAGWAQTRFGVNHPDFKAWKGVLRRPVVRLPKAKDKPQPTFAWWNGRRITYIEGRQAVYGQLYCDLIVKTETFARLKALYDRGDDIALFDFDGTDHVGLGRSYEDLLNDPGRPFGHGLLLCMLLEGVKLADLKIWEEHTFEFQRQNNLLRFDRGVAARSQ